MHRLFLLLFSITSLWSMAQTSSTLQGQNLINELVPLWPQHETLQMLVATVDLPDTNVQYEVVFDAAWSIGTHPDQFPPNPHFSGLIGGTHHGTHVIWERGGQSTPGMKNMAETGSKTPLNNEINAAIGNNLAGVLLSGGGIGLSPGQVAMTFQIDRKFPLVSLVTMIAPSPDWFVGVSGVSLFGPDGWQDEVTVNLFPYDAGTDSGVNYQSPDQATVPQEPIFRITGAPFLDGGDIQPLGSFVFRRVP